MPTPPIDFPAPPEHPFLASEGACSMGFKTPTKSRPDARLQLASGLADQKDTDRLMDIVHGRTDSAPPRPSTCPICGTTSATGTPPRVMNDDPAGVVTSYFTCAQRHVWGVRWNEVA